MINQTDIAHSTPPQLWPKRKVVPLTGNERLKLRLRIRRLAEQVEKLNWMLEWMDENMYIGETANLDNAEKAWACEALGGVKMKS